MSINAARLGRFHARLPGITAEVLARGRDASGRSSYQLLAELALSGERTLDLGCGDGYLLQLLAARGALALGVDRSAAELALAHRRGALAVAADAAALPCADAAFSLVVSHLAFSIMDPIEPIAAEVRRVLAPRGRFAAIVGGGPVATLPDEPDPFDHFLSLLAAATAASRRTAGPTLATTSAPPAHRRLGDPRACHLDGWRSLFPDFEISFTRHQLDLSGDFPTLWRTLSTTYDAALLPRAALDDLAATFATWCADRFAPSAIPLHMVLWLAVATRA